MDEGRVRAAGGAVWRRRHGGEREWAVIHRPRYDDWSLPKGKLDPGETWEQAAVREVAEEIGVEASLGPELPCVDYHDGKGRPKRVRYWVMEAGGEEAFEPNDEVDDLRWLPASQALDLLTYPRDRDLLQAAVEAGA